MKKLMTISAAIAMAVFASNAMAQCNGCGSSQVYSTPAMTSAPVYSAPVQMMAAPVSYSTGCNGCTSAAPAMSTQVISNGCGGCGTAMSAPLSTGCGGCGTMASAPISTGCGTMVSAPVSNGCGGCGTMVSAPISNGCGGCGTMVSAPISNGCGGCGTMVNAPISNGCGGCGTMVSAPISNGCGGCGMMSTPVSGCGGCQGAVMGGEIIQGNMPMDGAIMSEGTPVEGTNIEPESSGEVVTPPDAQTPPAPVETTEEDT